MAMRPYSILLVEDDQELANLVSDSLINAGFKTFTVGKVSDATMKLRNQTFNAVVVDLRLEQGTGEQVVSFMKQDKKGNNYATPIILTSGFMDRDVLSRIGKHVSGALVKPFDHNALIELLKNVCKKDGV